MPLLIKTRSASVSGRPHVWVKGASPKGESAPTPLTPASINAWTSGRITPRDRASLSTYSKLKLIKPSSPSAKPLFNASFKLDSPS